MNEVSTMKRSYSLDVFKLLFACVVAVFHFGVIDGIYADVAVQVFFVISGYFLAGKYCARSREDGGRSYGPWQYTLDHMRTLYPHYLLSLAIMLGYCLLREGLDLIASPTWENLRDLAVLLYDQLPDLLFLQSAFQYGGNLNTPTWQLSALLIAGFFVYSLLCSRERLCRELLFPAAVLGVQCLLATGVDLFGRYGFFYLPLLRAFGPLCLGVLARFFSGSETFARLKKHRLCFDLLSLGAVPAILIFLDRNGLHLVWAVVLILGCMEPENVLNRLLNRKCFASFGMLSYGVYLNHALLNRIFHARLLPLLDGRGLLPGDLPRTVLYLAAVLLWSAFTLQVLKWVRTFLEKRKKAAV